MGAREFPLTHRCGTRRRCRAAAVEPVPGHPDRWRHAGAVGVHRRGDRRLGADLGRDYRFNGNFYSDEIDYRGYPFGTLPLQIRLVADPSFPAAIADPHARHVTGRSSHAA